jgi:threonylcarbamoyladenosine tRNA methylthiotransferase MtaB
VKRVYLHTFGCKANQYDTERVRQALESSGAAVVQHPGQADAAVVNSCTVTGTSEAKMRGFVRRLARRHPALTTVVMGCAAALDDGEIAGLPGVTEVVGGDDVDAVLRALEVEPRHRDPLLRRFDRGSRAWLKIQDGCDEHCTFCATTVARGANRSRIPDEIVAEASVLSDLHDEIVLTGVHIGTYGRDLGRSLPLSRPITLGSLVEQLIRAVPKVRFRLSSVEATEVDDRLVDLMVGAPDRLAPHVHAPLQSGSDPLLKRMGRYWYTAGAYRRHIEAIAERTDKLGLGADIIVGFPGETDEDYEATRAIVAGLPFTYVHVFPYSERAEAPARWLGSAVDPKRVAERSQELRATVAQKGLAYRERRSGESADVVLLQHHHGRYEGLTEDYLTVYLGSEEATRRRFEGTLWLMDDGTLEVR